MIINLSFRFPLQRSLHLKDRVNTKDISVYEKEERKEKRKLAKELQVNSEFARQPRLHNIPNITSFSDMLPVPLVLGLKIVCSRCFTAPRSFSVVLVTMVFVLSSTC